MLLVSLGRYPAALVHAAQLLMALLLIPILRLRLLQRGATPAELIDALQAWKPLAAPKWVDRAPT